MLLFKEIIYQGIQAGQIPARTKTAREWYRDTAQQSQSGLTPSSVVRKFSAKRKLARPDPGQMYAFRYDPKGKQKLPYYDVFPLVFPVESYPDGFLGINFHYLPLNLRAKLMDALYSVTTDKKYNENTRLAATYSVLQAASKFKAFRPTVKRYLYDHVRSQFLEITAPEWDIALFLPMESFKKATKETVWQDSRGKI
jgi:hypothetical protein